MQTNLPSWPIFRRRPSPGQNTVPDPDRDRPTPNRPQWLIPAYLAIVLAHILIVAPLALLTILLDGLTALMIVLPPILAGLWFVPLFRLNHWPLRWQLLIAATLGLGSLSLLILILGTIGLLYRPVWITLLVLMAAVGIVRFHAIVNAGGKSTDGLFRNRAATVRERMNSASGAGMETPPNTSPSPARRKWQCSWLWLLTAPFLSASLLAASNPPGLIWSEEGYGYDVLEYHLQMPNEYFESGNISYAPHNVYAHFPANVEMLYLLGIIVRGDALEAGTVANFIHLSFAVLLVFAAWTAASLISPQVGLIAAVTMGTIGWLPYLSGLAYVENAMLFFGMASLALWLRAIRNAPHNDTASSVVGADDSHLVLAVTAGLAAGFACGCKYTALPLMALPVAIAWQLTKAPWTARLTCCIAFTAASLASFSPWLIKNIAYTGNPVFPLAHSLFQTHPPGWGPEEAERWQSAHSWPADATAHEASEQEHLRQGPSQWDGLQRRLAHLWTYVPGDHYQRFGPPLLILAMLGWWSARRTRAGTALLLITLVQLMVWMFATHLYARFAVVLLLPLAVLAGLSVGHKASLGRTYAVMAILAIGALWNLAFVLKLQSAESMPQIPASFIAEGQLPGYEFIGVINQELDPQARLLLVGEARPYYLQRRADYYTVFNRNPFVEAVDSARSPQDIIHWLRDRNYTHVLVNWAEVRRLRSTYGFSETITPDLFESLERSGLTMIQAQTHPAIRGHYVNLYAVPE